MEMGGLRKKAAPPEHPEKQRLLLWLERARKVKLWIADLGPGIAAA